MCPEKATPPRRLNGFIHRYEEIILLFTYNRTWSTSYRYWLHGNHDHSLALVLRHDRSSTCRAHGRSFVVRAVGQTTNLLLAKNHFDQRSPRRSTWIGGSGGQGETGCKTRDQEVWQGDESLNASWAPQSLQLSSDPIAGIVAWKATASAVESKWFRGVCRERCSRPRAPESSAGVRSWGGKHPSKRSVQSVWRSSRGETCCFACLVLTGFTVTVWCHGCRVTPTVLVAEQRSFLKVVGSIAMAIIYRDCLVTLLEIGGVIYEKIYVNNNNHIKIHYIYNNIIFIILNI